VEALRNPPWTREQRHSEWWVPQSLHPPYKSAAALLKPPAPKAVEIEAQDKK